MGEENLKKEAKIEINLPFLLVVEGNDEVDFFNAFFKHLKEHPLEDWSGLDLIQIISTDSKNKLKQFLTVLPDLVNIDKLKKIAIIQDADNDRANTFYQIQKTLGDTDFPIPDAQLDLKTGKININQEISVLILVIGIEGKGMLEDLCLNSVSDDLAMPCVDSYFECLANHYKKSELIPPKNLSKAKARVFLASRKECTIYIGFAAKEGYWDFDKPIFNDIKDFLKQIIVI